MKSLKSIKKSPDFYRNYASLFRTYFPGVSEQQLHILNRAGLCCYRAAVQLDGLMDEGDAGSVLALLKGYGESIRALSSLFAYDHEFWQWWELRQREFADSSLEEGALSALSAVEFGSYERLADGKSAMAKLAIDALQLLSPVDNSEEIHARLIQSHLHFSTALQLYDDLVDVREDFGTKRFNWVLYRYFRSSDPDQLTALSENCLKCFYLSGSALKVFALIRQQLQLAIQVAPESGPWTALLNRIQIEVESYRDQISGYVQVARIRHRLRDKGAHKTSWPEFRNLPDRVRLGLSYLESDYRRGWPQLRHIMFFSRSEGLGYGSGIHSSDVFLRAITDVFLTRLRPVEPAICEYLEAELHYFLRQRRPHSLGGWSYFPSLRTLSCDLDDQAEVMRFFHLMERGDLLEPYGTSIIDQQLASGCDAMGVPLTWVTGFDTQSTYSEAQQRLNSTLWGMGPHPEVVANFADCLFGFYPERHRKVRIPLADYLLQQQLPSGAWISRWYAGLVYGGYRIATYLNRLGATGDQAREEWWAYLEAHCNGDRGYGLYPDWPSDSLSTALAAISMRELGYTGAPEYCGALDYLRASQQVDGGWEAVSFVAPKPGQFFKSRSITTVYALNALCECLE